MPVPGVLEPQRVLALIHARQDMARAHTVPVAHEHLGQLAARLGPYFDRAGRANDAVGVDRNDQVAPPDVGHVDLDRLLFFWSVSLESAPAVLVACPVFSVFPVFPVCSAV